MDNVTHLPVHIVRDRSGNFNRNNNVNFNFLRFLQLDYLTFFFLTLYVSCKIYSRVQNCDE